MKLSNLIQKLSEEYDASYNDYQDEVKMLSKSSSSSRFMVSSELNKYMFKNNEKQKQLEDLKNEIRTISGVSSRISIEKRINLENDLKKTMKKVEDQENEQNSIKVLLSREKEAILNIREQLIRLTDDHRKITKSYSEAQFAREKAEYNFVLVNNEIVKAKKDEWVSNKRFKKSLKVHNKVKIGYENERKEIIANICKKISENEESRNKNAKDWQEMVKKINFVDEFQKSMELDRKRLDDYRQQIKRINMIMQKFEMETLDPPEIYSKESIRLLEKSIKLIINSYRHLKYKEESLSIQFPNLNKECSIKRQELENYSQKLQKLKTENEFLLLPKQSAPKSTFNLTKEKIENLVKASSSKERSQKIEEIAIKSFFEILAVLDKIMKKFEEFSNQSIEESGTVPKSDSTQVDTVKELISFHKYIKAQSAAFEGVKGEIFGDVEMKNSVQDRRSIRRDGWDIKNMVIQWTKNFKPVAQIKHRLGLKNDGEFEEFYNYSKKQNMLRIFINFEDLAKFYKTFSDKRDLFLNIDSLFNTSHLRCRAFYARLINMLTEIMQNSNQITALMRKGKFKFFCSSPLNSLDTHSKLSKRASIKYPTQREKIKARQEEEYDDIQIESFEPVKSKENNIEKKIIQKHSHELESPQQVLKEVLKIEQQIKSLKFKERLAGIKDNSKKLQGQVNLNQPWAASTPRAKSSHERLMGPPSLRMLDVLTPKTSKIHIRV